MIIRANGLAKLSELKKQIHLSFWSDMFFRQIKNIISCGKFYKVEK